ncbi:hypothetical protein C8J56DRAFT_232175 [Mycena floridula]|nr:hypothetical protein C8J56DRAFT_232175 [Mycena floridula]
METTPAQRSNAIRRYSKPSIRSQTPDQPLRLPPLKIKPSPPVTIQDSPNENHNFPQFPPPNVILHPEDANNKVLSAIVKSFFSVDNRAMTTKDLTDLAVTTGGLVCHKASAALQAISSYLRTHLERCELQQDQPLVLRHYLSGTVLDDDLVPALHSRTGGSHQPVDEAAIPARTTNFRKGTAVYYLSRVTGAPCPFSRVGIRLCDYVEKGDIVDVDVDESKLSKPEHKVERQRGSRRIAARVGAESALLESEQCGKKRKRSPPDSRTHTTSEQVSSDASDSERPSPPTRIKLTLRLKPLAQVTASIAAAKAAATAAGGDSDDDDDDDDMSIDSSSSSSMSSDEDEISTSSHRPSLKPSDAEMDADKPCLPPYPRRSISIPAYRPWIDPSSHSDYPSCYTYRRTRSPSIPYSVGSLPPDSGDEDDLPDRRLSMNLDESSFDSSDVDSGSSPGPRSPSASVAPLDMPSLSYPRVKQEPTDVQGILDAWEDLDHVREMEYGKPFSVPQIVDLDEIKREENPDSWDWDSGYREYTSDPASIKQEEDSPSVVRAQLLDLSFQNWRSTDVSSSPLLSPVSPASEYGLFSPFGFPPESPLLRKGKDLAFAPNVRPRAQTVPSTNSFFDSIPTHISFSLPPPPSTAPVTSTPETSFLSQSSLTALIESLTMVTEDLPASPQPPCISPRQMDIRAWNGSSEAFEPEIRATQIEGIPAYQMKLGSQTLLRRIDTDFVNLTPIAAHLHSPCSSMIKDSVIIDAGSDIVRGLWAPLAAAQIYVKDHRPLSPLAIDTAGLDIFLNVGLVDKFPVAVKEFIAGVKSKEAVDAFGKSFMSPVQVHELADQAQVSAVSNQASRTTSEHSSPSLDLSLQPTPLSPGEQEIFQALCVTSHWEKDNASPGPSTRPDCRSLSIITTGGCNDAMDTDDEPLTPLESSPCSARSMSHELEHVISTKPLRRSKRVADAAAAAVNPTRNRSRRKESRNSS